MPRDPDRPAASCQTDTRQARNFRACFFAFPAISPVRDGLRRAPASHTSDPFLERWRPLKGGSL